MATTSSITLNNIQSHLQSFKSDEALLQYLVERGILFTVNSDLGLTIIRYNREHPECDVKDSFTRFCRGLIFENDSKKIVCFPPEKSIPFTSMPSEVPLNQVEDFLDGTMINLFHYEGEWHISTRSVIGAQCRWFSDINFSDMFSEAKGNMDFDKFDKEYTYTFVLRHPENRIVTQYESADLVLVQVRNMETFDLVPNAMVQIALREKGVDVLIPTSHAFDTLEELTNQVADMKWDQQGMVIKHGNFRSKIRNEKYNYVKSMRGNTPQLFFNYLELLKKNMVSQYLSYFPEYTQVFMGFYQQLNWWINTTHNYYMNRWVRKLITQEMVPYELKPLIYEIHGNFLKEKANEKESGRCNESDFEPYKVTLQEVSDYFLNLPTKKIIFVMNYQRNQQMRMNTTLENESEPPMVEA